MPAPRLTNAIIDAAILGFEEQKRRIDAQIADLRAMFSGRPADITDTRRPRRKMSAAGRKAIAEAQRKRWAAAKTQSESTTSRASKPKRKLSAAGKAAIVAALKKRWAAKRAGAGQAGGAASKKTASKK
jgi:hypothetical protein